MQTLMVDEGFAGTPYDDRGNLTVGFGRNLTSNPLTKAEGAYLMQKPVSDLERDLDRLLPWWRNLNDVRQEVLANMCYNLGIKTLSAFTRMLFAAKIGDFALAAYEMRNSTWARQVGRRAERLAHEMETGLR